MGEIDFDQADLVIKRIAELAEVFAQQAGVGGMETAGNLVSYLATHPRDIEPCLRFGIMELPPEWIHRGCLTWHAKAGYIVSPAYSRQSRTIAGMRPKP